MENKDIYIDGVNVAGCPDIENMMCMEYLDGYCQGHNCYFKQLKRLEQENKVLLETLTKGCYQNLQHECRIWELKESKYRSALETIQRMILSAWEQGKYLDVGLYNDLTNEFAKINEVLQ